MILTLKISKFIKHILIFLLIVIFYTVITCLSNRWQQYQGFQIWHLEGDPFWNFSMTSKLASGYLPYKEINMIVNPLFFTIGSFFLRIFGNNGFAFHLFNGFIYGSTLFLIYLILNKMKVDKCAIIPALALYALISIVCLVTNYNHLAICFALMLFLIEICRLNNDNAFMAKHPNLTNILIGFLLICVFLTKQNIGVYLEIVYFVYLLLSEKKLSIKEKSQAFLYKCLGALIGLIPFLVYFTINNLWPYYYDLCIAGLKDFQSNCANNEILASIFCFAAIHMVYCYISAFRQVKNNNYLLMAAFLVACIMSLYPILDKNHIMTILPFITVACILLIRNNIYFQETYNYYLILYQKLKKYIFICLFICISGIMIILVANAGFPNVPEKYSIYNGYWLLDNEYFNKLDVLNNYIAQKESEGYTTFFLGVDATLYRWPLGINNNKKDLFMHGNVGKTGYEDTLNEIISCQKPLVIYNNYEICWQEFKSLDDFFDTYFDRIGSINDHAIYVRK